jgi:hypothetical protein
MLTPDTVCSASDLIEKALRSPGLPLEDRIRTWMESRIWGEVTPVAGDGRSQMPVRPADDLYEREAERIAEQALRWPGSPHDRPYDFRDVRIHVGPLATLATRRLRARAFTIGRHIFFAADEFRPDTEAGRRLLAHELVHVCQQRGCACPIVQRAEVDSAANPADLKKLVDCSLDINNLINDTLSKARKVVPQRASKQDRAKVVIEAVFKAWGTDSPIRTQIEIAADGFGSGKTHKVPIDRSKYKDVAFGLWGLVGGERGVLCHATKINNVLIGTDKLGHFFQQGHEYFDLAARLKTKQRTSEADADKAARLKGWMTEVGRLGLGKYGTKWVPFNSTGVYSKADLAANWSGYRFYKDLEADPDMTFDIRRYVNPLWNEEYNPNLYADGVGQPVWNTLLAGSDRKSTWQGQYGFGSASGGAVVPPIAGGTSGAAMQPKHVAHALAPGSRVIPLTARFLVTENAVLTGSFSYTGPDGRQGEFQLSDGRITYKTEKDEGVAAVQGLPQHDGDWQLYTGEVISGIRIDFSWKVPQDPGKDAFGKVASGKGYLVSVDESHLVGAFGNGASDDDVGALWLSLDGTPPRAGWRQALRKEAYATALTQARLRQIRAGSAAPKKPR